MKLQLIRNATQLLTINGQTLLIDPMLAPKGTYEAFQRTGNETRNPVADLPFSDTVLEELLSSVDAVVVTHLHLDHWDAEAKRRLPKEIPLICQPVDVQALTKDGFVNLLPVNQEINFSGIRIIRTGGQHGTGEIGQLMGQVSGFVFIHQQESLYIAGDTIWCAEVREALDSWHPQHVVVNGGGARFITGDPIVMSIADVVQTVKYAPQAKTYVVHLEAVNHAKESRGEIRTALEKAGLSGQCLVPADGDVFLDVNC